MKKLLFASVAGLISALAVTNGAFAQNSINVVAMDPAKDVIKMDKLIVPEKDNTTDLSAISTKAIKDFKKSYKKVSYEKWSKIQDGFVAAFTSNGVENRIFYNEKGRWVASLKGYTQEKLSRTIKDAVMPQYYDYKIIYVDEIETPQTKSNPTYIVHIEDEHNIKLIRVNDENIDVYQEFQRANN